MFAYSNHGRSFRAIDAGMEMPGEILFDHYATEEDLQTAFPGRVQALAEDLRQEQQAEIKARILALEAGQGRAIREAALTGDRTRLQAIEEQIVELRAQLA